MEQNTKTYLKKRKKKKKNRHPKSQRVNLIQMMHAAKSLQSCPTLCDPTDGSPPGSPIPGILQARTLEWVAISFSNAWKWKVKVKSLSRVQSSVTPWTAAHQAPPSMGFSRQEHWELPYDPAIPLLGIHTEETRIERDTCTPMFIAALFIIART